jgi:hypothetical protein
MGDEGLAKKFQRQKPDIKGRWEDHINVGRIVGRHHHRIITHRTEKKLAIVHNPWSNN